MKRLLCALLLCCLPVSVFADPLEVVVADPFLEMHTGPGRGYPVTVVVPRGERVMVLMRRTDWFKVREPRGSEGWVHAEQLEMTLVPGGGPVSVRDRETDEFGSHRGEAGVLGGRFDDENVLTVYASYALNPHLAAELRLSQVMGKRLDGEMMALGLTHVFRPDWRFRPFISLGTGVVRIKSEEPLERGRNEQLAYIGAGVKATMSRRLVFRAEFNDYVVFGDGDDNEEVTEWKLGFAFSF